MRLTVQPGIWKPAMLSAALTIRTTFTPAGADMPYADEVAPDGTVRYKWRGTDPQHVDNRALREAMQRGLSDCEGRLPGDLSRLLVDEDATRHEITVSVGELVDVIDVAKGHEPESVQCALCRLQLPSLLDAAHILRDGHERGDPVVPHGLAMCKIHHAAYDVNIIGIRPDHRVIFLPRSKGDQPDPDRLTERYEEFRAAA
jgi:putative restriction endonuclease